MRTRSFIGLIFLVLALLVASTPALLTPTANGIENAGRALGIGSDPDDGKGGSTKLSSKQDPIEQRLEIKGYVVEEDGDMREDAQLIGARALGNGTRLAAGSERLAMPGFEDATDPLHPTVRSDKGVLLDATGCPVFPRNADIAAILDNKVTNKLYTDKVASADNPTACRAEVTAYIKDNLTPVDYVLPGDKRRSAASVRGDSERLSIDLAMNALYANILDDWATAPDEATSIKKDLAASN